MCFFPLIISDLNTLPHFVGLVLFIIKVSYWTAFMPPLKIQLKKVLFIKFFKTCIQFASPLPGNTQCENLYKNVWLRFIHFIIFYLFFVGVSRNLRIY